MATPNPLFAPIARYRVTPQQPAKDDPDLDVDRCAALHNTLVLYGWVCSGKKIPDMKRRSWWSRHGSQTLESLLRPSLVRYLSKVFDIPDHQFFYHLRGLARPTELLQLGDVLEDQDHDDNKAEKYEFVVLYTTPRALVSHPAGIVYDQKTHRAILMPTYHHIFDFKDSTLRWQRLESLLSAYIDMAESAKATVVHDSYFSSTEGPSTRPWLLQPYTTTDLTSCLDVWKRLVHAIERRAEIKRAPDLAPLCSRAALDVAGIPHGFAYDLLLHAESSEIWFIAPGIRLPKVEEFLHQPFKPILEQYPKETSGMKMPFLFLRCPGEVSAKDAKFRYPFSTLEKVPCGLYLDAFPNAQNPWEDSCRLVVPIRLGGKQAYARMNDFRPIRRSYSDLYQVEINPFVMRHGPKLIGVLENWLENVESGHWSVNEKGVEGGIGMWRKADTQEDWWRYQTKHLYL